MNQIATAIYALVTWLSQIALPVLSLGLVFVGLQYAIASMNEDVHSAKQAKYAAIGLVLGILVVLLASTLGPEVGGLLTPAAPSE